MEQIIQLKKYSFAIQQIANLSDALFARSAELDMAQIRIAELEAENKQLKEKESEHSSTEDRVTSDTDSNEQLNGDGKAKAKRSVRASVPK